MNFKKRLLFLWITVILAVTYYYYAVVSGIVASPITTPPYVDGWNLNTSTNVSAYISEMLEPLVMPKNFCSERGILLVVIFSRPDNFEARSAIRETWAQKRNNTSFYFLLGEDKTRNYEVQLRINHESEQHNDIIQERFLDTYNNLTLKSVNMLKLFNLRCSKSYKHLLKVDDDVFLNVENLFEIFENRKSDTDLLVGKFIGETKPYRDPSSKWYAPYALYPQETYPDYLCGPAYLMSTDVAQRLYRCTLETPLFFIEDVYITGICAKKIKVAPQHHPMFTCNEIKKYECLNRKLYTVHYYTPSELRKSYKRLKENSCPPAGSWREWIFSLFY